MLALGLLVTGMAAAHPLAPILLELRETAPGVADIEWRSSAQRGDRTVTPVWPPGCTVRGFDQVSTADPTVRLRRGSLHCPPPGLVGRTLQVDGLDRARINVVLRWVPAGGVAVTQLLDVARPQATVPAAGTPMPVFARYLGLGVSHLLLGLDHVLFVLGLVLLVRQPGVLLATITAFTLGHSITLCLAALGRIQVNSGLTEFLIAVSLLVLALEVARRDTAAPPRLFSRRPYLMALGFGLFHGLGFASVLGDIGLPQDALLPALLAFNLGIELGQLALVLPLWALMALWRQRRLPPFAGAARALPVHLMGGLAVYWCLERATVLW